MKLAGLDFLRISGPVSFSLLVPTKPDLRKDDKLKKMYLPCIVLLGDEHESKKEICNQDPELKTMVTFSAFWLRLLDSLTTYSMKISYFVEGYIPDIVLNSKFYYKKNSVYNVSKETVMNYIPIHHQECFSSKEEIKKQCITSNIRYYFTDFRLDNTYLKLLKQDSKDIERLTSAYMKFLYDQSKIYDTEEGKKASAKRKDELYKDSYLSYEGYLNRSLQTFLIKRMATGTNTIGGKHLVSVVEMIYSDPQKVAKELFDIKNPQVVELSRLYQVANKLGLIDLCRKLFIKYFELIIDTDPEMKNMQEKLTEELVTYADHIRLIDRVENDDYDFSTFYKYYELNPKEQDIQLKERILKRWKSPYPNCKDLCNNLAKTIIIPFCDLYFLFKSYEKRNETICTLYNAKHFHTTSLIKILSKELYELELHVDRHDSDQTHYRCLTLPKLNLDNIFIRNIENQLDSLPEEIRNTLNASLSVFKAKKNLIKQRISILGKHRYREMLDGMFLTPDDKAKIDAHPDVDFDDLQLNRYTITRFSNALQGVKNKFKEILNLK